MQTLGPGTVSGTKKKKKKRHTVNNSQMNHKW